jgi:GT2 family glycosyltransferase
MDARLLEIANHRPAGFAANHNAAFKHCTLPYFCSLNPDISLQNDPFLPLLAVMQETGAAIAAPLVRNPSGQIDDSVRCFPTIRSLLSKAMGRPCDNCKIDKSHSHLHPNWVAGMFMLFRSDEFRRLQGFDERFFLYYEDVDICARAWKAGMKVVACPSVSVVHDAQRTSHHNFRYMRWHLASMARYFYKHWGRLPALPSQQ